MYPVVVAGAAGLVTRITALARSSSPVIAAASARLRALGVTIGSTADDMIAWVRQSPANAAMAAATLGSLGVAVSDIFESPDGKKLANDTTLGSISLADVKKILDAGASSEKLDLKIAENAIDVFTARDILRFAKSHYGSPANAVRAHKYHQAFFEMPLDDVELGFETIRL